MRRENRCFCVAVLYVKRARIQQIVYQLYVAKAIKHALDNVDHGQHTYTFVVDYGQNMELLIFNNEQLGCSYYYSPLSIYNLGVVNHAHKYGGDIWREHLHTHVHPKGVTKKEQVMWRH